MDTTQLRKQAEEGDLSSIMVMARIHSARTQGVDPADPVAYRRAIYRWCAAAAKQGSAEGLVALGDWCALGGEARPATAQFYERAVICYTKAAEAEGIGLDELPFDPERLWRPATTDGLLSSYFDMVNCDDDDATAAVIAAARADSSTIPDVAWLENCARKGVPGAAALLSDLMGYPELFRVEYGAYATPRLGDYEQPDLMDWLLAAVVKRDPYAMTAMIARRFNANVWPTTMPEVLDATGARMTAAPPFLRGRLAQIAAMVAQFVNDLAATRKWLDIGVACGDLWCEYALARLDLAQMPRGPLLSAAEHEARKNESERIVNSLIKEGKGVTRDEVHAPLALQSAAIKLLGDIAMIFPTEQNKAPASCYKAAAEQGNAAAMAAVGNYVLRYPGPRAQSEYKYLREWLEKASRTKVITTGRADYCVDSMLRTDNPESRSKYKEFFEGLLSIYDQIDRGGDDLIRNVARTTAEDFRRNYAYVLEMRGVLASAPRPRWGSLSGITPYEVDLPGAAQMYEKAALLGRASAMLRYADCLRDGTGVQRNLPAATEWYEKATEQGNIPARVELIKILFDPRSGATDPARAEALRQSLYLPEATMRRHDYFYFDLPRVVAAQEEAFALTWQLYLQATDAKRKDSLRTQVEIYCRWAGDYKRDLDFSLRFVKWARRAKLDPQVVTVVHNAARYTLELWAAKGSRCEEGSPVARQLLGELLLRGEMMPRDIKRGMELIGTPDANDVAGLEAIALAGGDARDATTVARYRAASRAGSLKAQAWMFENVWPGEKDKAADQYMREAIECLPRLVDAGVLTPEKIVSVCLSALSRISCRGGILDLYAGIKHDTPQNNIIWFPLHARPILTQLATTYAEKSVAAGGGVRTDTLMFLRYACGNYMDGKLRDSAMEWLEKLARDGNVRAMQFLSFAHNVYGENPLSNAGKAFFWAEQAASRGDAWGILRLAYCHCLGIGAPRNYRNALGLFQKLQKVTGHWGYFGEAMYLGGQKKGLLGPLFSNTRKADELMREAANNTWGDNTTFGDLDARDAVTMYQQYKQAPDYWLPHEAYRLYGADPTGIFFPHVQQYFHGGTLPFFFVPFQPDTLDTKKDIAMFSGVLMPFPRKS